MKDMIGKKFGKLTVLNRVEDYYYNNGRHDIQYLCQCDCGKKTIVLGTHLRSGHTTSCGCFRKEKTSKIMSTHKMSNTRLYHIWKNMRRRCDSPQHPDYANYGGRGIIVYTIWQKDFISFKDWAINNGYKNNLTIDRIDVNKNYTPDNCRWVTQHDQCNNTRKNIKIKYNGETKTLKEWCVILNKKYGTIHNRIYKLHWNPLKALLYK